MNAPPAVTSRWLPIFSDFVKDLRITSKEESSEEDRGVELKLWESQKRFMKEIAWGLDRDIRTFYCLKSRQLGVTTISLAIDLFWLAMHKNLTMALVTENEKNRDKNRTLLKMYLRSFPEGYFGDEFYIVKGGDNRQQMRFSNGSRLDFLIAGTKKKSTAWGEGEGYAAAHLTEVASYGSEDGLESFVESFAQTNPSRLYIFESTAKGFNLWSDWWKSARGGSFTEHAFFIGWWASKTNRIERDDLRFMEFGRAPANKTEREKIELVARLYGYEIDPEQLAWIRWREDQDARRGNDRQMLDQNQPWCVRAGTRVGTARGILKVEDVREGDITAFGPVSHAGPTGMSTLWRAKTEMGYEIIGTANHPLIDVDGNEVPLEMSMGVRVRLHAPVFSEKPHVIRWRSGVVEHFVEVTSDLARFIGLFLGDGSATGSPRSGYQVAIACSSVDQDTIAECQRLFRILFGVEAQLRVSPSGNGGGHTDVRVTSKLVYDTLRDIGVIRTDTGPSRRIIRVPEFIWQSPKHVVREFLRGLFEADGFNAYATPRVVFCSYKDEFIADVHLLLLAFGVTGRHRGRIATIKSTGRQYHARDLCLRREESIRFNQEIGFISERKNGRFEKLDLERAAKRPPHRKGRKKQPIVLEDHITEVENLGVDELVYNLTVPERHWFDANGILTHNTESDAFIQSGYSFFPTRLLTRDIRKIEDAPKGQPVSEGGYSFKAYRYAVEGSFFNMRLEEETEDPARIELRVWEEPYETGHYVVGCDPAWGRNEHSDRSAISVWRCYADKLVQVAEFASADVEIKHCAWVLAHLAGAYVDCVVNYEVNGPGNVIKLEWDHVRGLLNADMYGRMVRERDWTNALSSARWYLYSRPDAGGRPSAIGFSTTFNNKSTIMHGFKGSHASNELEIRSLPLLREMVNVQVTDGIIGAPESKSADGKDDRVFGAALAHRAWVEWVRPSMLASGETWDKLREEESRPVDISSRVGKHVQMQVMEFFRTQEQRSLIPPPSWRNDYGL